MPRRPDHDDDAFRDRTLEVFQPRTSRVLTREDAREIRENLTGFFRVLMEWDARARLGSNPEPRQSP